MEKKDYLEVIDYLESRSVTELETVIIKAYGYKVSGYDSFIGSLLNSEEAWDIEMNHSLVTLLSRDDNWDICKEAMKIRYRKLNDAFEWTSANCERLLYLNNHLIDIFEKLKNDASNIMQRLCQQVADAKFNISGAIRPRFYSLNQYGKPDERIYSGIEAILMDRMFHVYDMLGWEDVSSLDHLPYFDYSRNWNIELLSGHFGDNYISYAMYELTQHCTGWSLPDILRINWFDMGIDVKLIIAW
jgi:hypothetical protein